MRARLVSSSLIFLVAVFGFAQTNQKQDSFKLSEQEKQLLDLTNAERKKENLPLFQGAALLFKAARAHSSNMAKQEKLDHELDCKTPFDRLDDVKYDYQRAAENVALSAGEPSMADILKLWMDSDAGEFGAQVGRLRRGFCRRDAGSTLGRH